jgi:NAD(P)-dependent dehydrogenase (short-subunit alcohol dehydrogenase family)
MSPVFLVTGSSRGLGRFIVEQALAEGHCVVATARNPRALDELASQHRETLRLEQLDVTDPAAAERVVAASLAAFGRLDVVVNNAGQADRVSLEDTTIEVFHRQIKTNFLGTVYVTKAAVPIMRRQGGGRVIQISSLGDRIGSPGVTAYQSAKWAVGGFSEALAAEVAPLGIKITILEPGGMRTDWGGASMATPPISDPYQATVGASARAMQGFERTANGDPAKVAGSSSRWPNSTTRRCACSPAATPTKRVARRGTPGSRPTRCGNVSVGQPTTMTPATPGVSSEERAAHGSVLESCACLTRPVRELRSLRKRRRAACFRCDATALLAQAMRGTGTRVRDTNPLTGRFAGNSDAGGGTRTPDTRIMIPLL